MKIYNFNFKLKIKRHFPYTHCLLFIVFLSNFSFFVFQFHYQNWKRKEFFEIHFLIWNEKMNSKILTFVLNNEKWKNFKIGFVFKSKNELDFRYTYWIIKQNGFSIFKMTGRWNSNLKFVFCFSFSFEKRKIKST